MLIGITSESCSTSVRNADRHPSESAACRNDHEPGEADAAAGAPGRRGGERRNFLHADGRGRGEPGGGSLRITRWMLRIGRVAKPAHRSSGHMTRALLIRLMFSACSTPFLSSVPSAETATPSQRIALRSAWMAADASTYTIFPLRVSSENFAPLIL